MSDVLGSLAEGIPEEEKDIIVRSYRGVADFEDGLNEWTKKDYRLASWRDEMYYMAIFVKRGSLADKAY